MPSHRRILTIEAKPFAKVKLRMPIMPGTVLNIDAPALGIYPPFLKTRADDDVTSTDVSTKLAGKLRRKWGTRYQRAQPPFVGEVIPSLSKFGYHGSVHKNLLWTHFEFEP
jgi:hypothetical protein